MTKPNRLKLYREGKKVVFQIDCSSEEIASKAYKALETLAYAMAKSDLENEWKNHQ